MSVFRAANNVNKPPHDPYRINRSPQDTVPDGPTERIDERTARRRRERVLWLILLVAVFALVTASIAVFAAWRAMNLSRLVATAVAAGPVAPVAAEPRATGFTVTYAQESLRVQVGCSAVLFLDLDEPRANADEKVSDLRYDSRCGQDAPRLTLGPGAAAGAQVKDSDTDAEGCQQAIRSSPIGPGGSVEVRKGVTLCVLTAAAPPSMSLVEITDVGTTGTAGMRATSWKVAG